MSDMLGTSALAEVAGPLKDLWERLGGKNGKQWLAKLKHFLREEERGFVLHIIGFLGPDRRFEECIGPLTREEAMVWLESNGFDVPDSSSLNTYSVVYREEGGYVFTHLTKYLVEVPPKYLNSMTATLLPITLPEGKSVEKRKTSVAR